MPQWLNLQAVSQLSVDPIEILLKPIVMRNSNRLGKVQITIHRLLCLHNFVTVSDRILGQLELAQISEL